MWHRVRLESRKGWSHECLPLFHLHISFVGSFPFLWCGVPHHRQRVNTPAPPGSKWCGECMLHLPPFIAAISQGKQREMERGRSDSPRTPLGPKGVESSAVMSHAAFSTVMVWLTERTMDLGTTENISAPLTQENKSARDSNVLFWVGPFASKATVKRTFRVSFT